MLSGKDMLCIDAHCTHSIIVLCLCVCFSVFLCVSVLSFLRICMMVVLGCTHCLLPTKRVTDDTESVGGGRTNQKTFTEKKIPIYILFPSLSFEPMKALCGDCDSGLNAFFGYIVDPPVNQC